MPDGPRAISPPPSPPPGYPGPDIKLVDCSDQAAARLSISGDHVAITIRQDRHLVDTSEALAAVLDRQLGSSSLRPITQTKPWATRPIHATLLVFLASHWPEIAHVDGGRYHVTLAYALPLALDQGWRNWTERHAEQVVAAQQLVAVPAANLLAVIPALDTARRHRRLLRTHANTTVREHNQVDKYLDEWDNFSFHRYGRTIPDNERIVLHDLLAMSGCTIRDVVHNDRIIGQSVVCMHTRSAVLFDLMATWRSTAARLRPGIYSGVYNLIDAQRQGVYYSMCYGNYPYKADIVGKSTRVELDDLLPKPWPVSASD